MTNPEIRKAQFEIGGMIVDCYKDAATGQYYLNQTQTAKLVDKSEDSIRKFMATKTFKALRGNGLQTGKYSESQGRDQVLLDLETVSVYIFHWSTKGEEKAQLLNLALMRESLLIRAKSALGEINDAGVDAVHRGTNEALEATIAELEQRNADLDQLASELYGQTLTLKETVNAMNNRRQLVEESMNKALDQSGKLARQTVVQENHGVKMHKLLVVIHECINSRKKADKDRLEIALGEISYYLSTGEL